MDEDDTYDNIFLCGIVVTKNIKTDILILIKLSK